MFVFASERFVFSQCFSCFFEGVLFFRLFLFFFFCIFFFAMFLCSFEGFFSSDGFCVFCKLFFNLQRFFFCNAISMGFVFLCK